MAVGCNIFLVVTLSLLAVISFALDSEECYGRRIYIRRLPSRFNLDLLSNCSDFPLFTNFCEYTANHGLGLKTHNASQSWFRTDPHLLELFFHRRILEYPCLTADPAVADAIFLPYYAGIDALKYLYGADVNSSFEHGLDLYHFLRRNNPAVWDRRSGHDHFLMMARPAWDFSQPLSDDDPPIWGTSFLELPESFNVTALTFEARAWPWQEQAIPYPTSFHPPSLGLYESWIRRVRRSRRTTLALFAGGGGTSKLPNIRRSIRTECEDNSTFISRLPSYYAKMCDMVDCSNGICEHDPIRYMRPMLQASFCLQPPGDTPTRRSTFDGILAGCIPVFFEEHSSKTQYTWHLPEVEYDELSVLIPKEEVVFGGVRIMDVLTNIPSWKVKAMREKVVEVISRVIYKSHGSSPGLRAKKDAFDIAVEGVLKRVADKLEP